MCRITRLQSIALVACLMLLSSASEGRAQCHGGGQNQTGTPRGMQTMALQQGMLQTLMNQQQSSLTTPLQFQTLSTNGLMQQQQLALLAGLQQLQQARQLSALQQPQQLTAASAASPKARSRRHDSTKVSENIPAVSRTQVLDSATDEEIAARRLRMAKDLASDATLAQGRGERRWATKLRERAGERLSYIVENYATTSSADEAKSLFQSLNP